MYLFGYVFEILVKTAYYRFVGLRSTDSVAHELRGLPSKAKSLGLEWQGNRHNVESVAQLLIRQRRSQDRPLHEAVGPSLVGHAAKLSRFEWSEKLRYKNVVASDSELLSVRNSVDWVRANYAALWS